MADLLYITAGLTGAVNAGDEMACRLQQAGHTVTIASHRDLRDRIEAAGFPFVHLQADEDALSELSHRIESAGRVRALPDAWRLRKQFVHSTELAGVVGAAKPDGLIIDVEAHYAVLATRHLQIPTMLKSCWFSLTRRRGIPPLHSPMPLPATFAERRQADLAWGRALGERLADNTIRQLSPQRLMRRVAPFRYNTIARSDLRAVAKANDVSLRALTSQTNWLRPHLYPSLPMITTTAAELDFGFETNPLVHSVGPMVRRDRAESATTEADHARWRDFRDRNTQRNRPLLYCSFGTMLENADVTRKVIDVVKRRTDWDLVLGGGGLTADEDHAPNIIEFNYAPQLSVLQSADVAIGHAGINSINECMVFGVPMLVDTDGAVDQPGCAARVQHHGIGLSASLREIDDTQIELLIEELLTSSKIRSRTIEFQSIVKRYESDAVLESLAKRLIAGRLNGQ
jgi:UDP:flavonoid glycosyltransferase YjiC (YdhE family)